jgi:DNA-directed RNA polymerase subunit K/omega
MSLKLSRALELDVEQCVENAGGNRFDLVIMASARVRELSRQHKHSENRTHIYPALTALAEFQEGKIGKEYLKRIR